MIYTERFRTFIDTAQPYELETLRDCLLESARRSGPTLVSDELARLEHRMTTVVLAVEARRLRLRGYIRDAVSLESLVDSRMTS